MDINSLVTDPYLYIFLGGITFYFLTLFLFIEKVQDAVKKQKESHDSLLIKKYGVASVSIVQNSIDMFDSLRDNRNKYEKLERIIDTMHWCGIFYLVGTVLGFILKQVNLKQDIAIGIISAGFLYFFIILIYLIFWYRKNR